MLGTVKWFNDAKGFGFIDSDCGNENIFAHYSAIKSENFRTLAEGDRVEFDLSAGPKGFQAYEIKKVAVQS